MICLLFLLGCKKDTIENSSEPDPQPIPDYRNSFVGTYSGSYFNYNMAYSVPPLNSWSYSEGPATNYTITFSKVAGQGYDSLIYSNEILEVLPYATYWSNDTFLIRSNGLYNIGKFPELGKVQFIGDSLKTDCYSVQGAQNTFIYGRKFRGKK